MSITIEDKELNFEEDVHKVVSRSITETLKTASFERAAMDRQMSKCVDMILSDLSDLQKPFKFAVTIILSQKVGAGLASSACMFWDPETDGHCKIVWSNDELQAVVTVFGICTEPHAEHRQSQREVVEGALASSSERINDRIADRSNVVSARMVL